MEEKNNAGEFTSTMSGKGSGTVPCGECIACCTSSKFIHIRPTDIKALSVIPREIMFPAPRLPKGHYLLGYSETGYCPMFQGGTCSIYEYRPETCRQYDCRALAATGASLSEESPDIRKQVDTWEF